MDDTWVIQQKAHKQAFLDHINSIDPAIKFTVEGNQGNRAIPFLDILVIPQADYSLSITVYHKPTHTDQYLQWDSHHNLSAKYIVIGTLTHRAKTVCTRSDLFQELEHLREALVKCKYPHWAISRVQGKYINSNLEDSSNNNSLQDNSSQIIANLEEASNNGDNNNTQQDTHNLSTSSKEAPLSKAETWHRVVIIPCTKGISESFKKICGKYGIQTYFTGTQQSNHSS